MDASGISPEFPEAAQGPVAYGSTPYVDQADVLAHIGNQLTVRGDTFVIRTLIVPVITNLAGERFWWPRSLPEPVHHLAASMSPLDDFENEDLRDLLSTMEETSEYEPILRSPNRRQGDV